MVSGSVLKPDKSKNADFWLKQTWRLDIVHHDWLSHFRTGTCRVLTFARLSGRSDRKPVGLPLRLRELKALAISPLCSNIMHSTFPHQPKAGGPPFLSRTGNLRAPAPINSNSFCEIALFIFSSILISSSKNVYLLFYAIPRRIVNR